MKCIIPQPLQAAAFAAYGQVIEPDANRRRLINGGATERYHGLASADCGADGAAILSIFRTVPKPIPLQLTRLERHPLGSQAFVPMERRPWLVVVADRPVARECRVFIARGDQGVQFAKNIWHHPLIALGAAQDFLVVDREGPGKNFEAVDFDQPIEINLAEQDIPRNVLAACSGGLR